MFSKILKILQFLFGLTLLAGLAWSTYLIVDFIARGLARMKSDLAVAIVAAAASVMISMLSLFISKRYETRASITQELRAKKTPIYEEFIATLYRMLFAEQLGQEPMSEAELKSFFASYTEKLTIWGSDGVIKTWRDLRMSAISNVEGANMLFLYENLLMEIRKDLGHKNQGFKRGTLLGLFVNDIDKYL
jgi:hypothetical protein